MRPWRGVISSPTRIIAGKTGKTGPPASAADSA